MSDVTDLPSQGISSGSGTTGRPCQQPSYPGEAATTRWYVNAQAPRMSRAMRTVWRRIAHVS